MRSAILSTLIIILILATSFLVTDAQDNNIECYEDYEPVSLSSALIDISALPGGDGTVFANPERVVAFTFPNSQTGIVASTARANCDIFVEAYGIVKLAGMVWLFEDNDLVNMFVVAFNNEGGYYFLDQELNLIEEGQAYQGPVDTLSPGRVGQIPRVDVSISSATLCFYMDIEDSRNYQRYCPLSDLVSAVSYFESAYQEELVDSLYGAFDVLAESLGLNVDGFYMFVHTDRAVSEILGDNNVEECRPLDPRSNCEADVVVAPVILNEEAYTMFASGVLDIRFAKMMGVMIVNRPLDVGAFDLSLTPGMYLLENFAYGDDELYGNPFIAFDRNLFLEGELAFEPTIAGMQSDGEIIYYYIPGFVDAPFVGDRGTTEIFGLQLFYWCLGECR